MKYFLIALVLTGCSSLPERSAQDWAMQDARNKDIFMSIIPSNQNILNLGGCDNISYCNVDRRMMAGQ